MSVPCRLSSRRNWNSGMITDWNGMNIPTSISVNSRCAPRNGVLDSTNPLSAPTRQERIMAGPR